ncbi:hypothetical protein OH76DRAFT_1038439 [Lentinus brumalis]|uniref:Uncharacterized protein n=1 Tax=Lentinus brumalis TaxID=2498619 RepID=A0A371CXA9_9APHY|nr:hypothetical protein OH76DRAFT_1038439 [Polyporus brumalis]
MLPAIYGWADPSTQVPGARRVEGAHTYETHLDRLTSRFAPAIRHDVPQRHYLRYVLLASPRRQHARRKGNSDRREARHHLDSQNTLFLQQERLDRVIDLGENILRVRPLVDGRESRAQRFGLR